MNPALSILDPSPRFEGQTARDAFEETLRLAAALDGSSYQRYWVQEHHNTMSFAGVAPEVLIAALTQRTRHLKLGSGGVMLPNYSPLKVAEQFCALEALAPGRIELGLGRATGADPRASAALLGPGADAFPVMMRLLLDWLLDASGEVPLSADHRARGIHAGALGARPDVWMLCSSPSSAGFAGAIGVKLAFADFLSPGGAAESLAAYRAAFRPSPFADHPYTAIGLTALAAPTQDEARALAAPLVAWNLLRQGGVFVPFPRADTAHDVIASAGPARVEAASGRGLVGDAQTVAARLQTIAQDTSADEFFILTVTEDPAHRQRSYQLIAEANA
jgi:luciferase family oxidoreductase group 1